MNRSTFEVSPSPVLGIPVVRHRMMGDERGQFGVVVQATEMAAAGLPLRGGLDTINYSGPRQAGCTFGIHVGSAGKYITVLPGTQYYCTVVDLRDPDDSAFGRREAFYLVAGTALYVPQGYGNAGQALTDGAYYLYALDRPYDPGHERRVHVSDPELGIPWPLTPQGLSPADAGAPGLDEFARVQLSDLVAETRHRVRCD